MMTTMSIEHHYCMESVWDRKQTHNQLSSPGERDHWGSSVGWLLSLVCCRPFWQEKWHSNSSCKQLADNQFYHSNHFLPFPSIVCLVYSRFSSNSHLTNRPFTFPCCLTVRLSLKLILSIIVLKKADRDAVEQRKCHFTHSTHNMFDQWSPSSSSYCCVMGAYCIVPSLKEIISSYSIDRAMRGIQEKKIATMMTAISAAFHFKHALSKHIVHFFLVRWPVTCNVGSEKTTTVS